MSIYNDILITLKILYLSYAYSIIEKKSLRMY